jgi:CoA:oxalate CoA-transferase
VMDGESSVFHAINRNKESFAAVDMLQTVARGSGASYQTTRCPITVDGQRGTSPVGSPAIGQHNQQITKEFMK